MLRIQKTQGGNFGNIFIFTLLGLSVSVVNSNRYCFNCSSVDDHYCPEFMNYEDENIVPYASCQSIYEAKFCIKTTGVNGGALGIQCFRCNSNLSSTCSTHEDFHTFLSDCKDVFEAYHCIKTLSEIITPNKRSLGTTRFCSSRDMGNYCEYIRRPGDKLEYRSCVFTCSTDGCNGAQSSSKGSHLQILITIPITLIIIYKIILK